MGFWKATRNETRDGAAVAGEQPAFPEHAFNRREQLDADIKFGWMEMWVGVGSNQPWPWLDVAVRIGKGWGTFVDHYGGLIKRPDFIAFLPELKAFAEERQDVAELRSLGGSMRLRLTREFGDLRGEARFDHGPNSQIARFRLWKDSLRDAVPAYENAVRRVEAVNRGWIPRLGRHDATPRAALLEGRAGPSSFKGWVSGYGEGGDVRFDYEVDGYGWYGVTVQVGDNVCEFGGGWLTDCLGDLLRAALLLLAGRKQVEVLANAEPGQTCIEFEVATLRCEPEPEPGVPGKAQEGCWIRVTELYYVDGKENGLRFEQLARSPFAVAEAIYAMALPHFADGAGPWSAPMAALEGALATVPRE
ncbi:hypothetical protein [Sphingomonas soli]|uniref:hypothetical protein n=1 Tax=Sphingomonas soli TaxID=266127 RepID=UPI00082EE022|nr:hypothetical protein [Sphingomonas soli]